MPDAPPGNETIPEDIRLQSTVDLIEIKYTYDLLIHERVTDATAQHSQLRQNLLNAGWGTVNIHPFIVGSAGTIRKASHSILNQCGITDPEQRNILLRKIAIHSANSTAAIVRARLAHKIPDPAKTDNTTSLSGTPPPSPPSSDTSGDTPPMNTPTATRTPESSPTTETDPQPQNPQTMMTGEPRRGSRIRTPTQRVKDMEPETRRAIFPEFEITPHTETRFSTACPDRTKLISQACPHTHHDLPQSLTEPQTQASRPIDEKPQIATSPATSSRHKQHKRRASNKPPSTIKRLKRTPLRTPTTQTSNHDIQTRSPLDDVTHPAEPGPQDTHQQSQNKRRASHTLSQSPKKRLRVTPSPPSAPPTLPKQRSGTPFDRG